MKKLLPLLFALLVLCASCSSAPVNKDNPISAGEPTPTIEQNQESDKDEITLIMPQEIFGQKTPDAVIKDAKDQDITASLNEDGTYTYTMSKKKHSQMMASVREILVETIGEALDKGTYPNVSDVTISEDFTHFILITDEATSKRDLEPFVYYILGMTGTYHTYSGMSDPKITFDFQDAETGEVFHTFPSSDD